MIAVIIVGVVEVVICIGVILSKQRFEGASQTALLEDLQNQAKERLDLRKAFEQTFGEMIWWGKLKEIYGQLAEIRDLQKLERGRVTITQAELETVENRLRELDEVDREIQASGLETKEELRILNKKEKDLRAKNEQLKERIKESISQLEQYMSAFESNSQLTMQIENIKNELLRTEQKSDELLIQIEQGNEQYFTLKQVYDALDIEYAQLYEKFSESNQSG